MYKIANTKMIHVCHTIKKLLCDNLRYINRLVGLVAKVSVSRAEDLGFDSHL